MKIYSLDPENGIWIRPGFTGIDYSDGQEVEERILSIMTGARDRSVFSDELRSQITDWPTEYHFSWQRHCLLRPLPIQSGDRVLELGCGCGALTRYLGEIGAEVVAVEGGIKRAKIAAARCRDLKNVRIVLDNLVDFATEERFDWVLLIGVLEYAPIFAGDADSDPVERYLKSAASFLAREGNLVIAIENQLGLKYFNGCGEDHLARPFLGLHDLYGKGTPVTFGKRELEQVCRRAGLLKQVFYYPWPDYKLPAVILHSSAYAESDLNISDLLFRCFSRDYQGEHSRIFAEQFVMPVLERNGLLEELANSFLLVAGKEETNLINPGGIAWFYASGYRQKQFCTETRIQRKKNTLIVGKSRLVGTQGMISSDGPVRIVHRCDENEVYQSGELLSREILRKRYETRSVRELAREFLPWFDVVLQHAICTNETSRQWLDGWSIPGDYIDATPFNAVRNRNGEVILIDREWVIQGTIPLGWLLYRSVVWDWCGIIPDRERGGSLSVYELVSAIAGLRALRVRPGCLADWERLEQQFQESVSGKSAGPIVSFLSWRSDTCLASMAEQQHWIEMLMRDNASLANQLTAVYASESWRYSHAIRLVGSQLRKIRAFYRTLRSKAESGLSPRRFYKILVEEGNRGIRLRLAHLLRGRPEGEVRDANAGETARRIGVNDYAEWIRRYDTLTSEDKIVLKRMVSGMKEQPLLSIIMPVFDPPIELLREAIESIRNQVYGNWQLCIADDASTDEAVRDLLEQYEEEDRRISIAWRDKNGHISRASNSALAMAKGAFVVLMDQDDLLPAHALFLVAETVNCHSDVQMIYSDEDKIDLNGVRHTPSFKCDWNPDLFLSYNYFSHLGVYRSSLVREVGGFRPGFEGAQDYDLALRCMEKIRPDQIVHIPHILYHWRTVAGSTSLSTREKPYAIAAGKKALDDFLRRNGWQARCEEQVNSYRIRYTAQISPPLVSLVIPVLSRSGRFRKCIESIVTQTDYAACEVLLIDAVGLDARWIAGLQDKIEHGMFHCLTPDASVKSSAGLFNFGVAHAQGDMIALLHDDVQVITPGWLSEMVSHGCRDGVAAVGARLWYPNRTLQHGGMILGIHGTVGNAHRGLVKGFPGYRRRAELIQNFSAVSGACMVMKKELFEFIGGFDEGVFSDIYYDVDCCLKLAGHGFRHVWTPYAELYHSEISRLDPAHSQASRLSILNARRELIRQWENELRNDPAYNPNLTLDHEDFSLAWPPRNQWLKQYRQVC